MRSRLSQSLNWQKWLLLIIGLSFFALILLAPLLTVFYYALEQGITVFVRAISNEEALAALWLTIKVALISLPINIFVGIVMAWTIAYYNFKGKALLTALLDLPFAISPVVVGLMFLLLFGLEGLFGGWLYEHQIRVMFALPSIVMVTLFVTFPLIAKSLIPTMTAQGNSEEQAALILGASTFTLFFRITLPKIKWALIYGVILSNARAMGEFGAVSVVSGHIRGLTNTIPLYVEISYNEYQFVAAFACSALLALLAIFTLLLQHLIKRRHGEPPSHTDNAPSVTRPL
ncbi:sulfate transport system permease protein [Mesocricetibacter intestinalis]|uniref:Sulfate transport system permease protein n=1 Tax=Mesocricetibacter intestinalis TaxID=1521930 RepID=A0A4R6VEM4_9PAST|nr:sulfate ABC transporter permease subunit CysW [Mesocricetibacter intestinalis]TDQ58968.1 sulfate transport system permease protein [Mesocricetibacter intestinalis]